MNRIAFLFEGILHVVFVVLILGAILPLACHPGQPVVTPNPTAADCIVDRTKAELDCVKDNSSRAAADACIDDVKSKKECVDGGK